MFCPQCEGEYREGFSRCADCDLELVAALPEEPPEMPEVGLEMVYWTRDPAMMAVVESLLAGAEIQFMAKGVGWGRFHTGVNPVTGPVEFFVREDEAEAARKILGEVAAPPAAAIEQDGE